MVVTAAQMKELERRANQAGLTYREMMRRAGHGAAREILAQWPHAKTAAVVCGKGNNGGDGLVVARRLARAGIKVRVYLAQGQPVTPDAVYNWYRTLNAGVPVKELEHCSPDDIAFLRSAELVVDALYGTGFHGQMQEVGRKACHLMNHTGGSVVALDLPSGLEADTGRAAPGAVRAELTVTFHAPKPCHQLAEEYCGRVATVDLGIGAVLGGVP